MQKKEAIQKYMENFGGDGHSIVKAEALVGYGFTEEFVGEYAYNHESGEHYKEMIFSSETGKKLDSLFGVYSLSFAYAIARDIGADTTDAQSKMGRGFQAQELAMAINQKLKEME